MIEIWGKTQCPYCDMAKRLCETNGYEFIYKQLGEDFQREDVMEQFPGARTFPQIIVNDENIGGYTELEGLHKGGQL
jgi:glutaredoxin 3